MLPAGHILDVYRVRLSNAALNFWNSPARAFSDKVTPDIDLIDEAVVQCYVSVVKILL